MGSIFKDLKVIEIDFDVNWENGASRARAGTFDEGYMFPLLVKEQLDLWPEKNVMQRRWV